MRILMVSQHYPPFLSGYGIQCATTSRLLQDRGHAVLVVTSAESAATPAEPNHVLRVLKRRRGEKYLRPAYRRAPQYVADLLAFRRNGRTLRDIAREFRPHAVLFWQFESLGLDVVQEMLRRDVPVVFNSGDIVLGLMRRGLERGAGTLWRIARWVYPSLVRSFDRFTLAVAGDELRAFMVESGYTNGRLTVVNNGIASDLIAEAPPEPGPGTRLLFAGRIDPWKGVDVAVRALGLLNSGGGPRFALDLVGGGEDGYLDRLRDLARGLGVAESVHFLGRRDRDDLIRLYADYDMMLLPSIWREGQPLSVMEAMGRGVPVVASAFGGLKDVIRHGRDGLLVEPGDPEALAGAVGRLARDDDLRRQMAERAIERIREQFTLERHARRIEQLLERVVRERAAG